MPVLITPNQVRGLTREQQKALAFSRVEKLSNGGEHHIVSCWYRPKMGALALLFRYWAFARKAVKEIKKMPLEISGVFCWSYPPLMVARRLATFARKRGIPFLFDVHDIHPEIDHFLWPFRRLVSRSVNRVIRLSFTLFTLSEDMRMSLIEKGADPSKIVVIRPWGYEIEENRDSSAPFQPFSGRKMMVSYVGNIGKFQGIEMILACAKLMEKDPVQFLFVGSGSMSREVKEASLTCDNVSFSPKVDEQTAFWLYCNNDVNLITLKPGIIRFCCPSKTPLVFAAKKPVVIAVGESRYAEELAQHGAILAAPTPEAICEAIRGILLRGASPVSMPQAYFRDHCLQQWKAFFEHLHAL